MNIHTVKFLAHQKILLYFISVLLLGVIYLGDITQKEAYAQSSDTEVYWVYTRGDLGYRLKLKQAAQRGIAVDKQGRQLTFRIQMTQNAFNNLSQNSAIFPINVEWYKYNRAKLSLYSVSKVELDQITKINLGGNTYHRISSTQRDILEGTWIVKLSDANGNYLSFNGKTEFDAIVF